MRVARQQREAGCVQGCCHLEVSGQARQRRACVTSGGGVGAALSVVRGIKGCRGRGVGRRYALASEGVDVLKLLLVHVIALHYVVREQQALLVRVCPLH